MCGGGAGEDRASGAGQVKTDQRDAERVLRLLMIDALHPVRVPTVEEEALRDLVRAREDLRGDLMRARQRLSKLLLRHGIVYEDTSSTWTQRHRAWLRARISVVARRRRCWTISAGSTRSSSAAEQLETTIGELVPASPYAQTVARLRCLRGIDTLSAVGLAAEIGDFTRFERPGRLMSYLGLVPSETSSRRDPPPREDHEDRLAARPPAAGRGQLALPQDPRARRPLQRRQEGQPANVSRSPGRRNAGYMASGAGSPRSAEAPHDRRGRRRPRTRRVLLGARPRRLTAADRHATSVEEAAGPGTRARASAI